MPSSGSYGKQNHSTKLVSEGRAHSRSYADPKIKYSLRRRIGLPAELEDQLLKASREHSAVQIAKVRSRISPNRPTSDQAIEVSTMFQPNPDCCWRSSVLLQQQPRFRSTCLL